MIGTCKITCDLKPLKAEVISSVVSNFNRYKTIEEITGIPAGFIATLHAFTGEDVNKFEKNIFKELEETKDRSWDYKIVHYIAQSNLKFVKIWSVEVASFIWMNMRGLDNVFLGTNKSEIKKPGLLCIYSCLVRADKRFTIGSPDEPREIYCRTMRGYDVSK